MATNSGSNAPPSYGGGPGGIYGGPQFSSNSNSNDSLSGYGNLASLFSQYYGQPVPGSTQEVSQAPSGGTTGGTTGGTNSGGGAGGTSGGGTTGGGTIGGTNSGAGSPGNTTYPPVTMVNTPAGMWPSNMPQPYTGPAPTTPTPSPNTPKSSPVSTPKVSTPPAGSPTTPPPPDFDPGAGGVDITPQVTPGKSAPYTGGGKISTSAPAGSPSPPTPAPPTAPKPTSSAPVSKQEGSQGLSPGYGSVDPDLLNKMRQSYSNY